MFMFICFVDYILLHTFHLLITHIMGARKKISVPLFERAAKSLAKWMKKYGRNSDDH